MHGTLYSKRSARGKERSSEGRHCWLLKGAALAVVPRKCWVSAGVFRLEHALHCFEVSEKAL